jgi:hypothetical protein
MKLSAFYLGAALALAATPAFAAPLPATAGAELAPDRIELAQSTPNGRAFRRCMRAKYGPRYFARVPRTVRWHMSQACMA